MMGSCKMQLGLCGNTVNRHIGQKIGGQVPENVWILLIPDRKPWQMLIRYLFNK